MAFIPTSETLALIAGIGGWAGVWHATNIYLENEPLTVPRVVKMATLPVIWGMGCVTGHFAGYCIVRTCSVIFNSMFHPVPFIVNILALSVFAIAVTTFVGIRKRFRCAAEIVAEELAADAAAAHSEAEESDDDSSEEDDAEEDAAEEDDAVEDDAKEDDAEEDDAEEDDSQTEERVELEQLQSSATQPPADLPAPTTLPASPFEQQDDAAVEAVVEATVEAVVEHVVAEEPVVTVDPVVAVEPVVEPVVEPAATSEQVTV